MHPGCGRLFKTCLQFFLLSWRCSPSSLSYIILMHGHHSLLPTSLYAHIFRLYVVFYLLHRYALCRLAALILLVIFFPFDMHALCMLAIFDSSVFCTPVHRNAPSISLLVTILLRSDPVSSHYRVAHSWVLFVFHTVTCRPMDWVFQSTYFVV